jgi:hypothetical protein
MPDDIVNALADFGLCLTKSSPEHTDNKAKPLYSSVDHTGLPL